MLNFVILAENRDGEVCSGEGGLSVYIKNNDNEFLFDTGHSDLYKTNAEKLGIDLSKITTIVLSHGHSDHTDGVAFLDSQKTIIMHPEGFKERYSKRQQKYVGFPMTKEELESKHNVILTKDAFEVVSGVFYIGEIPMNVDFEKDGNFSTTLDIELTQTDYTEDDSGIAIKTNKGLVIMTGCGHRGICNTIERAKEVTGENRVYAVLGGFHLRDLEKQKEKIDKTINYFDENGVQRIYLGHCVTDDVIEYFEKNANNLEVFRLFSGSKFTIED